MSKDEDTPQRPAGADDNWLRSDREEPRDFEPQDNSPSKSKHGDTPQRPTGADDDWLRSRGTTARQSLWILGQHTPSLARDIQWWIPREILKNFKLGAKKIGPLRRARRVGKHRVVGFAQLEEEVGEYKDKLQYLNLSDNGFESDNKDDPGADGDNDTESTDNDSDLEGKNDDSDADGADDGNRDNSCSNYAVNTEIDNKLDVSSGKVDEASVRGDEGDQMKTEDLALLVTELHQPLSTWYAMDLFSSFMRAVAGSMATNVPGEAEDIRPDDKSGNTGWKVLSLRKNHLSKVVQDVYNTGLRNLAQVYLSILTPLSVENKLPGVSAVVNLALQNSKRNEQSQRWQEAGDDLIWLSRLANTTFEDQSPVAWEAAANLIEYSRLIDRILKWKTPCDPDSSSSFGISTRDLEELHSMLAKEVRNINPTLREPIEEKARLLGLIEAKPRCSAWQKIDDLDAVESRDILHRTVMHYAVLNGSSHYSKILLRSHSIIDAQALLGRTALHYTCLCSDTSLEIVNLLLSHGASLNIRARNGATPLHWAAMTDKEHVVKALVEAGAAVDVPDLLGGSPLHTAVVYGHLQTIKHLWEHAKKDLRGRSGWTVLHLVATSGKGEVAEFLVENGVEQLRKDHGGRTALQLAIVAGNLSVCKILFRGELDLELKAHDSDGTGWTALHLATDARQKEMVEYLIDEGANTEAERSDLTPLGHAVKDGHEDMVHLLLELGANFRCKNRDGNNLLHMASEGSNVNIVKVLIEEGLRVNSMGSFDMSPLHFAAESGRVSIGRRLLEQGANVDQADSHGRTPLWFAVDRVDQRFEHMLLVKGASVDMASTEIGQRVTLLERAANDGNKKIIDLFHFYQSRQI